MPRINKSIFTPEELASYEALIAKAKVDPEKGKKSPKEDVQPKTTDQKKKPDQLEDVEEMDKSKCKKSVSPELEAALGRFETLEKSLAMKELTGIAKKYAALGEKEDELAKTLYEMKKSNEENYKAYIDILDKSLGLVEKSGVFSEIGKSGSGTAGGVLSKIETAAGEIMKADAGMNREQAIAKAWENHPELIEEYEAEYRA